MKKLKKFVAFSLIGLASVGSYTVVESMLQQNIWYQKNIATPVENLQDKAAYSLNKVFPLKTYWNLRHERKKYEERIVENISLVKSLSTTEPLYHDKLTALPIFAKDNTVISDKVSGVLIDLVSKFSSEISTRELVAGGELKWTGDIAITNLEKATLVDNSQAIYIGLNAIKDTKDIRTQQLLEAFRGKEDIMFDYLFFHELGHFLSHNFKGKEGEIEYNLTSKIIEEFQHQQNEKLSIDDKNMVRLQFTECVGDVIALQLLYVKHPQLKEDKNLIYRLAKARAKDSNDIEHLTSVALFSYQGNFKAVNPTLEDILSQARHAAMDSTEFYSPLSFVEAKPSLKRQALINITKGRLNYLDMHSKITQLNQDINQDIKLANPKGYK